MTIDETSYSWWERRRDRLRGRRDGRRRHPPYGELKEMAADGTMTAPYPDQLLQDSLGRVDKERLAFERQAAGPRATLARLRADKLAAVSGLDRRLAAVTAAQAELTDAELRPRNYTEMAPDNQLKLLVRRDEMRERRIEKAHDDVRSHEETLKAVSGQIAVVEEQIRKEFVIAQVRARQVAEKCALRVTTYWENVVLLHPEGPYMVPLLRFTVQIVPSWVVAPSDGDPINLGRGPFELVRLVHRLTPKESA